MAVVVAVLAGVELGGIAGIFVAVPVVALVSVAARHWLEWRGADFSSTQDNTAMLGRIHVQPDDVPPFLNQEWIVGQLERVASMRLQPKRAPDLLDGGPAQSARVGHPIPHA